MKSSLRFMLCALGVMLLSGTIPTIAAGPVIDEFLAVEGDEAKQAYLDQMSDEGLFRLANEAGERDPSGRYLDWILLYGLKPRWDRAPPTPEAHLAMIGDPSLSPPWRAVLISVLPGYSDTWNVSQTETAIKQSLELLRLSDWSSVQKVRIAAALDRIVISKATSILDDDRLSLREKQLLVNKLHLVAELIIDALVNNLKQGADADDRQLRAYVIQLHSFAQIYLTQEDTYPPQYREGAGFAQAARSAQTIRPVLKHVLTSGKYPPDTVLETIRGLKAMNFSADVPEGVVGIYNDNPKFTAEKLQILSREVKAVRVTPVRNGQDRESGQGQP